MPSQQNRPHLKKIMEDLVSTFGIPGTKEWVQNIEDPLDYDDPHERQAVIGRNLDLLKQKMGLLQHFSNISPESATQYVENSANFGYEEWQQLERAKRDLGDYEEAVRLETQTLQMQRAIDAADAEPTSSPSNAKESKKNPKKKMGSYRGWIPS